MQDSSQLQPDPDVASVFHVDSVCYQTARGIEHVVCISSATLNQNQPPHTERGTVLLVVLINNVFDINSYGQHR